MIVRMKKITLFCTSSSRDATLERLRELGVLHVTPITPPAGQDLAAAQARLAGARRALDLLPETSGRKPSGEPEAVLVDRIGTRLQEQTAKEELLARLKTEQTRLQPLGDFDPETIRALAARGVYIHVYHVAGRKAVRPPAGAIIRELGRDRSGAYLAVISRNDARLEREEIALPARSLSAVETESRGIQQRLAGIRVELERLAADRSRLELWTRQAEAEVQFLEVRQGMGSAPAVTWLQGFCPAPAVAALGRTATEQHWGLFVEDPTPADPVPTLIANPFWIRPIKAVFDLLGILPGYWETDISAIFLVFFSIFFAMLVGDAGYGGLFLALTLVLKWKWKAAPPQFIPLMVVLSAATVIWGVLTGSYFGILRLPAPLKAVKVDWLTQEANIETFCFFLGALHLTVAHAWNIVRLRHSTVAIAQAGWICLTWTMYFMAVYFVVGRPAPAGVPWLFGIGAAAVALFMVPWRRFKAEWSSLVMLPLTVIGNFGDVVSYLRLYLVGSASVTLVLAFNDLAAGRGIHSVWAGLAAALIIFAAHALNILLCCLAVLVHGVRLNALEFSLHLGIQWSGLKYKPFERYNAGSAAPAGQ